MTLDKKKPHAELFQRIANGDREAEVELLTILQLYTRVKLIVDSRLSARAADKEDIVSDVIVALLVNLRKGYYDPAKSAFTTYAWAITANKIRDYLRPGATKKRSADSLEEHHLVHIDQSLEERELQHQLRRAVKSLPSKYRRILMMRYFEELTIREIAAQLNLSENQVYNRIHYALALIRRKKKNV